jgi:arginyl-tRNA--protein-N-Asp/Glu arginylyltransferase
MIPEALQYYATAPYDCSYIEGQIARSQVAAPAGAIQNDAYTALIHQGFRRSGAFIYRPQCDRCQACQSIRLPVLRLLPNRSQVRAKRQHGHMQVKVSKPYFSAEHYALYARYQSAKHTGGGMDHDDASQYVEFLVKSNVDTMLIEFREPAPDNGLGVLKMVSIVDKLQDGLSAVYTFYDPTPGQSLGTYNVMWQVEHARSLGLAHLYLGYWIENLPKMSYKARFRPAEILHKGQWQAL